MLNKKEVKRLKSEAHHLKPELNIGKEGITNSFINSLHQAFNTKELLKIKVLDNCVEDFEHIKNTILESSDIEIIQKIGRTLVLYKPEQNPN